MSRQSRGDDIYGVAHIAARPIIKRHQRLGVVAPLTEVHPANAAGLRLSLRRAPDLTKDLLTSVFLLTLCHTIIISEFLHPDRHLTYHDDQ